MKNTTESFVECRLLERRTRVGDRGESFWCLHRANRLLCPLVKILLEDVGLECAAGFARHQEQCAANIDARFEVPDLRRVGGVEYAQPRVARLGAEGFGEDLRAEARATHAEQQHILKPGALNVVGEVLQMGDTL